MAVYTTERFHMDAPWSWEFQPDMAGNDTPEVYVRTAHHREVCRMTTAMTDFPVDELQDLGQLIAAAPDLLAALRTLLGDMPDIRPDGVCRHCCRVYAPGEIVSALECHETCPGHVARAAIAKATGDPHARP